MQASSLAIVPHEIYDLELLVKILSENLNVNVNELLQKVYQNKHKKFFYLKRKVKNLNADRIMELQIPGLYREYEYQRVYPANRLASNLIGFVGRDMEALEGLELAYDDLLTKSVRTHSVFGTNLQLTLDSFLQKKLEEVLMNSYISSKSKKAGAILMDIHKGHILAMVSLPNFDPNYYYKSTAKQRINSNIRLNYEPGSTIKIFMAAMLLEEGVVKEEERFFCPGKLQFHSAEIACKHNGKVVCSWKSYIRRNY